MKNSNRKGGAAVVALLVMIIIIAVSCALMVVTGRKTIKPNESVSAPAPEEDTLTTEEETNIEEELAALIEEPKPSLIPNKAEKYETVNLKDITCQTGILLDCETNEILAGVKYDKKIYPASLTKLMTLLVAVENIDDMQAKYKFTKKDIEPLQEENASCAGFVAGDEVTMEDLLYAAILPSGADGTLGLANAIAGSEKAFVKLMNDKVADLGLTDTNFANASGLHHKQHYTTAQDIAVITKACMDNETCRKVLCTKTWTTKPTKEFEDGIELDSIFHSRFDGYFIDADQDGGSDAKILGGKTGFTDEAGYTLATVVEYKGKEYISVTTKSETYFESVEDSILIFENYLPGAVGTPDDRKEKQDEDSSSDESQEENDTTFIEIKEKTDSSSQSDDDDDSSSRPVPDEDVEA
jgi:D-alanyl-D-alanine carboxypeptidase (penicillin-binding protein 5/6)